MTLRKLLIGAIAAAGFWLALVGFSSPAMADVADPFAPAVEPGSELPVLGLRQARATQPELSADAGAPDAAVPVELSGATAPSTKNASKISGISRQNTDSRSSVSSLLEPVREVVAGFGSALARASSQFVTACEMGAVNAGAGGLVLLAAVIGRLIVVQLRRNSRKLDRTDIRPREFLYAWDVIAPG